MLENMIFGTFIFMMLFFVSIFAIAVLAIIFWIFMLVDAARRNFKDENDKVVWILIVVLLGLLGAIIYYFVIKIKDKKK